MSNDGTLPRVKPSVDSIDFQWLNALRNLIADGEKVNPRGHFTLELPQQTIIIDTRRCVLTIPERRLSYKFMAAEALWILTGDDRVSTIAPWNANITQFSDDGETFAGAYGPRIVEQLPYVINTLCKDASTRQAGLTIWRPSPSASKDIPCTVALWFMIREQRLNVHAFMRSSDVWLGLPYDAFNFSMMAHHVTALVRHRTGNLFLSPGRLFLTMASSHLYDTNVPAAGDLNLCLDMMENAGSGICLTDNLVPEHMSDPMRLVPSLLELRGSRPGDTVRWWEVQP